ncbi:SDR family oxidoreductase [Gordonia sp. VNK21]|uniref:SDR family oxidoreductase n=1 Tax=Gordonia sp. VNK21 TaxID=3382483 RepID=UPI0038D3846E
MAQRVALVTGSNGGIGTAIVARLREDGFRVVTVDLTPGADLTLDVVNDPLPEEVFGHVDVCVSNAGIVDTIAPAHSMSVEKWNRDISVNLTGAFRVIQACLPGMRERRYGRVVAVSSMAGRTGLAGKVAYAASKAGLQGAVRTVAIESLGYGITANCIQPGFVETAGLHALRPADFQALLSSMPEGRFCQPAEIANLIAFLSSEGSGSITGQDIAIDGGIGLHRTMIAGNVGER